MIRDRETMDLIKPTIKPVTTVVTLTRPEVTYIDPALQPNVQATTKPSVKPVTTQETEIISNSPVVVEETWATKTPDNVALDVSTTTTKTGIKDETQIFMAGGIAAIGILVLIF